MQFSSNEEQSQESDESAETNNAETAINPQEIDDSSNSETTTSVSKRARTNTFRLYHETKVLQQNKHTSIFY